MEKFQFRSRFSISEFDSNVGRKGESRIVGRIWYCVVVVVFAIKTMSSPDIVSILDNSKELDRVRKEQEDILSEINKLHKKLQASKFLSLSLSLSLHCFFFLGFFQCCIFFVFVILMVHRVNVCLQIRCFFCFYQFWINWR